MKRPLFDIIISAHTGYDGTGAFDVRIVLRGGECIGSKGDVTLQESMEFATDTLDNLWAGIMRDGSN